MKNYFWDKISQIEQKEKPKQKDHLKIIKILKFYINEFLFFVVNGAKNFVHSLVSLTCLDQIDRNKNRIDIVE